MITRDEALAAVERIYGRAPWRDTATTEDTALLRDFLKSLPEVEELAEEPPVEESPIYIAPWERALLGSNVHPDAILEEPKGVPPWEWSKFIPAEEEPRADS
jgi:hypothetical protein